MFAIHWKLSIIAEIILLFGPDVNIVNPTDGYTALHYAIKLGNTRVLKFLLNQNANLDIKTKV